jgi:hypothetical protein
MLLRTTLKQVRHMIGTILGVAAALGVGVGAFILHITWDHNPQCEFHCDGVIHWGTWLPYGGVAGLVAFIVALPIGLAVAAVVAIVRDRRGDSDASAT